MSLLTHRTVILVKTETTEGSNPTPAATDALLAEEINVTPVVEFNDRNPSRATLDTMQSIAGKKHVEVTFRTEVKCSGTPGTAYAPLGAAIQACGFTEAVSGGVSVTYAPTSAPASASYQGPGKTCTIEAYHDGMKRAIVGCRGNMKIVIGAGMVAYYEFTMRGTYAQPTDVALPTTTYLAGIPPATFSATLTLHGYASAVVDKFEVDCGNELSNRPSVNAATGHAGFLITKRNPVGSTDPEAVLIATKDFEDAMVDNTLASSSIVVTGGAGQITTITLPKTQIIQHAYGDRGGIRTFDLGLAFRMNSGDDFMTLVMT